MNVKKVMSRALAGTMALALTAMPVLATDVARTSAVIDKTMDVKLTLHKLIENDGNNVEADGLVNAEESRMPVDNIQFSYWKIADIVNVTGKNANGKTVSGVYYTNLAPAFLTLLGAQTPAITVDTADIVVGGDASVKYYTTEALEKAMKQIITTVGEDAMNTAVGTNGVAMPLTNAQGASTVTLAKAAGATENANQGLYLIAETDISYHDGAAGTFDDNDNSSKVTGVTSNTLDGRHYYIVDTITGRLHDDLWNNDANAGEVNSNQGSATATAQSHAYKRGDLYQESQNPEAPVIQTKAAPFLVSLPTTNTATIGENEPGTLWQYDVDVYPKNQSTQVVKRIVDPDELDNNETLRTHEDYQIGDTIEQIIWADVPALQQNYLNWSDNDKENEGADQLSDEQDFEIPDSRNMHTAYKLTDTMSPSWTFDRVTKVVIVEKPASYKTDGALNNASNSANYNSNIPVNINEFTVLEELAATDYQLITDTPDANGIHGFTVQLTEAGLTKINSAPYASVLTTDETSGKQTLTPGKEVQIMVCFESTLNKAAIIGETFENQNYPTLTWQTNTMAAERQIKGNEIYAYTYELDLTKAGLDDASQARFIIGRTDPANNAQLATGATSATAIDASKPMSDLAQDASKDLSNYVSSTDEHGHPKADQTGVREDGVRWVKEADGVYHVYDYDDPAVTDGAHGDNKNDPNALAATVATTDYEGKAYADRVKTPVGAIEVSDINGKLYYTVSPAEDGTLILKGFDSNQYTFKEVRTEDESNLLKSSFTVSFTAEDPNRDGKLKTATVDMDGTQANLDINAENGGIAAMIVNNYDAVDLRTGGVGRFKIYAIAGASFAMLGAIYLATRKREDLVQ